MIFLPRKSYFGIRWLDESEFTLEIGTPDSFILWSLFVGRGTKLKFWRMHLGTLLWIMNCCRMYREITFKIYINRRKKRYLELVQ